MRYEEGASYMSSPPATAREARGQLMYLYARGMLQQAREGRTSEKGVGASVYHVGTGVLGLVTRLLYRGPEGTGIYEVSLLVTHLSDRELVIYFLMSMTNI